MARSNWTVVWRHAWVTATTVGLVLAFSGGVDAGAKRTFKLGTTLPPDNIITRNAMDFAKKVNDRTKGELEVTVYPALTLGN